MTYEEFEKDLIKVAEIQRKHGWSEHSIRLYEQELRSYYPDGEALKGVLLIGAGLAQDNRRFGVFK